MRQKEKIYYLGTERAFSSEFNENHKKGTYVCTDNDGVKAPF